MIVLNNSAVPETVNDSHTISMSAGSSAAISRKASSRPLMISSIFFLPSPGTQR